MADDVTGEALDPEGVVPGRWDIERAVLNESAEGQRVVAAFVRSFGAFVTDELRPVLRRAAVAGDEPQLIVNGVAALLRSTADAIEFPLDHPRAGSPKPAQSDGAEG
jgi:hypothetical protein